MNMITREDLKVLARSQNGICISIYMPAHRAGLDTRQDPIRFKNLLRDAEERLIAGNLRAPEAKELLKPAQELLDDALFWKHQGEGLAIFLSPDTFRYYTLCLDFQELVVVTSRFHLKPLFPFFSGDGRFYVLALNQNDVRFFRGSRHSISEIDIEGMPKSLAEALKYDVHEKQLQPHSTSSGASGQRSVMFHGHGEGTDQAKENIRRFFLTINNGLHGFLKDDRAPLLLAGVDFLLPIYRETSDHPYIVEKAITGNTEGLSLQELHGRAWTLLEPLFLKGFEDAVAQYERLAGTNIVSKDLKTIILAANQGRVGSLFVAVGIQQWGAFDPDHNEPHVHQEAEPGDEDLLDLAAVQTLLNGGDVYAVEPEKMPDGSPVAAVFRY
jgi:hypothetical protein